MTVSPNRQGSANATAAGALGLLQGLACSIDNNGDFVAFGSYSLPLGGPAAYWLYQGISNGDGTVSNQPGEEVLVLLDALAVTVIGDGLIPDLATPGRWINGLASQEAVVTALEASNVGAEVLVRARINCPCYVFAEAL